MKYLTIVFFTLLTSCATVKERPKVHEIKESTYLSKFYYQGVEEAISVAGDEIRKAYYFNDETYKPIKISYPEKLSTEEYVRKLGYVETYNAITQDVIYGYRNYKTRIEKKKN